MSVLEGIYRRTPVAVQSALLNAQAFRIQLHRYGRRFHDAVEAMEERERWSPEEIGAFQDERLRQIVTHAYERTAFYRKALTASGVHPSTFRGRADLHRLPIITKLDIRARAAEFLCSGGPRRGWLNGHTSGTTGSPLSLWYDRLTCEMTNAVDRRHKAWLGMETGDWIGLLLGRVIVPLGQRVAPFWRANRIQRQLWLSSFHMSPENLRTYVEEIRRRRIRFLEGYPSTLFVLARHLLSSGERLPMRAVISSSETLHDVQKEVIETAFECEMFDFYALAERVIYAGECEHHAGKHLAEDYGYAEVVDAEGALVPAGKPGYLVGTTLWNSAMPLIRYRTDDLSELMPGTCPCGRSSRRIADVTTKAEDIIVTPDGRAVSPSILTHPFKPLDGIVKSQIVQSALDEVLVRIVPATHFPAEEERQLRRGLEARLGAGVSVEIVVVDEIPREPSGKYRWVISTVQHEHRLTWEA